MAQPFVLGVNYWPRRKAMYWWSDFDAGEVRDEFALIADLGMNVVRLFLLWDDWQPTPDTVSTECLKNLETVCDIAAEHGLGLDVTFFTGHMSGPNWSPGWLLASQAAAPSPHCKQLVSGGQIVPCGYRNMFSDPVALVASRRLLTTVVAALKDHPGIWMWNLGNEPDLFAWPSDAAAGRAWVREMTQLIKTLDDKHPVTCGLHVASLHEDNGLRVDQVFAETDVAVMHGYPMYLPWAQHSLDPDLVPYTCALVSALCGKPTLMEEWGGCTNTPGKPSETWEWTAYGQPRTQFMASEEDLAAYVAAVLPRLVEVGATGAMLWCFADYSEDLWEKPPCKESKHERFFGLVRPDGSLKPHAEAIRAFAKSRPIVNTNPARQVALNITPDEFYTAPAAHTVRLYQQYLATYEGQT
ncbi:MAG: cellulase family glycosylhydrolase [Anaerolineaceae bacterium]|nr:cellulase family glycosylhydrolase [Anaerolineaceae bacterium]